MLTITIKQVKEINLNDVQDLIETAIEGGIGYWAKLNGGEKKGNPQYLSDYPFTGGSIFIDEMDNNFETVVKEYKLDLGRIVTGLQLMADVYENHWNDFITGNYDAITGDVLVQLALFGEIKYC